MPLAGFEPTVPASERPLGLASSSITLMMWRRIQFFFSIAVIGNWQCQIYSYKYLNDGLCSDFPKRRVPNVLVFLLGDSPASEFFCAGVSEHTSIFIGKHNLGRWNSVFRNVGTYNSDFGESPNRKTTFRTRLKFEIKSRVRCWIHFVRWFIVRRQNFPCHLVHTNFVGCF